MSALDITLGEIRAQFDHGVTTIREGADLRIAASEHHIEAVRALSAEYFGGNPS